MNCQRCDSSRIADMSAKCSDLCFVRVGDCDKDGYVPDDMGVGGSDYVEMKWCLECGQIQGKWPLDKCSIELLEGVKMRKMTKPQRETLVALADLSPGRTRPWLNTVAVVSQRCKDKDYIGNRGLGQMMCWLGVHIETLVVDGFVEKKGFSLFRITNSGKKAAKNEG